METETQSTNPETNAPTATNQSAGSFVQQNNQTLMAVLAYLGILILIPFLMSRDNAFVKYHLKQGLILIICEAVVWTVRMQSMFMFTPIFGAINIALFVLAIIGVLNAIQGKEKEIPLIGGLARYIHF